MPRFLVFSDLDGTLLDHDTYSFEPARPALERLRETGTPLVLVSSKTRPELEAIRRELHNRDPYVVENGGAVFLPRGCGLTPPAGAALIEGRRAVILGRRSAEITPLFDRLAQKYPVRALSRMTEAEAAALTGLSLDQARSAKAREFGEAFVLEDLSVPEEELAAVVAELGLNLTRGGRFYHLLGGNDKGRAVSLLIGLYRRQSPDLVSAAVGDAPNDLPMLAAVNRPFLGARPDGSHHDLDLPGLARLSQPGPAGFNQAVWSLLGKSGS
ncbi:MAG: HAD-IIB family hydrolase [Thermodesulfobacteriota bacterium]